MNIYHEKRKSTLVDKIERAIPSKKHRYLSLLKKKEAHLHNEVLSRTSFLKDEHNLSERLLLISCGFTDYPKCVICENEHINVKEKSNLSKYCSNKCMYSDTEYTKWRESKTDRSFQASKMKKTNLDRYGVEYQSQRDCVKEILKTPKISRDKYLLLSNKAWVETQYKTKTTITIGKDAMS